MMTGDKFERLNSSEYSAADKNSFTDKSARGLIFFVNITDRKAFNQMGLEMNVATYNSIRLQYEDLAFVVNNLLLRMVEEHCLLGCFHGGINYKYHLGLRTV
jgi:hypothetical protein